MRVFYLVTGKAFVCPMDPLDIAQLLCARICHDMAGPVGAASAGAELFEDMDGRPDAETLALVAASAQSGAQRLKFFRAALGPTSASAQSMRTLRDLCDGYLRTVSSTAVPDIRLSWPAAPDSLDGTTARLLLNLVLLAKDCLPRGGAIALTFVRDLPHLSVRGTPVGLNDEARAVLLDGTTPTGPKGAQAYLTRDLAHQATAKLIVLDGPDGLTLSVERKN